MKGIINANGMKISIISNCNSDFKPIDFDRFRNESSCIDWDEGVAL